MSVSHVWVLLGLLLKWLTATLNKTYEGLLSRMHSFVVLHCVSWFASSATDFTLVPASSKPISFRSLPRIVLTTHSLKRAVVSLVTWVWWRWWVLSTLSITTTTTRTVHRHVLVLVTCYLWWCVSIVRCQPLIKLGQELLKIRRLLLLLLRGGAERLKHFTI